MSNAIYHVDLQHFLGDFGLPQDSITEKIAEGFCTLAFFQAFYWGECIKRYSSVLVTFCQEITFWKNRKYFFYEKIKLRLNLKKFQPDWTPNGDWGDVSGSQIK